MGPMERGMEGELETGGRDCTTEKMGAGGDESGWKC